MFGRVTITLGIGPHSSNLSSSVMIRRAGKTRDARDGCKAVNPVQRGTFDYNLL